MSSVRNPVLKKQLAYARDHYTKGNHNDKCFRKAWPKIKRRMVRAGRHIVETMVRGADDGENLVLPLKPKRKHQLHKRNAANLRQVVKAKSSGRLHRAGAKGKRQAAWQALLISTAEAQARQESAKAIRLARKKKKPINQISKPTSVMRANPGGC